MTDQSDVQAELLAANASYASQQFSGPLAGRPARQLSVLTCMDCRLGPLAELGLQLGDAHLIRNAGGLVTDDVLRSLAISQHKLGTRHIAVVQHTECGMFGFDDPAFRAELSVESGEQPGWDVPGFTDLIGSVRESVLRIRQCGWLPHRDSVRGYVFDVRTAELAEVG